MESSNCAMVEATIGDSREIDEEAKEWEHKLLQSSMDKELHELNRCLEEKESEMLLFDGYDPAALKQHFGRKLPRWRMKRDLFREERNRLLAGIENLASVGEVQKLQNVHAQNLKSLEVQLQNLKKKQENHCQLLKQKQKSDDAARRLEEEFYPSRHRRFSCNIE
ncbi:kinesin-like protein KIN-4A [Brassica rapa]|nr:kinesin-like protein KIN-4A [Brassica rapa]